MCERVCIILEEETEQFGIEDVFYQTWSTHLIRNKNMIM